MVSSDVSPAPLGPITEIKSPRLTSRLTRLTACTPPNAFETSWICRSVLIALRRGPRRPPPMPPPRSIAAAKPPLEASGPHESSWCAILAESPLSASRSPLFQASLSIHRTPNRFHAPSAGFAGAILPGGGRRQAGRQARCAVGRGAKPPSELGKPSLPAAVVLHVAVALALPHARQAQVELLDVLVVADRPRVAVEHDATGLHHVAV